VSAWSKITSRYWYRSRLFWVLFVISSYALVGFLVLPNIIKNTLIEQVEQNLGWQSRIEKVELNPFTLTLTINKLVVEDKQGDVVISFDRYHNDIELRSIIEGALTFSNLELVSPYIKLVVDNKGKTNFQNALEQAQAGKPQKPAKGSDSGIPKLLFDVIKVEAGEIDIVDHTPATLIKHHLKPLSFTLNNFSTFLNKEGTYQLAISLGGEQQLTWKGDIGVAPFNSTGFLKIEHIKAHQLWGYAQDLVPYTLAHGLLDFEGQYNVSLAGNGTELAISNATVMLDEIQIAIKNRADNFLNIDKIKVGSLDFNLGEKKLAIGRVAIDAPALKLERNGQGELPILTSFTQSQNKIQEGVVIKDELNSSEAKSPFKWSIGELLLNNGQINVTDLKSKTAAHIAIKQINSQLSGLSQDLSTSLDFGISYFIENSGKSEINGQVVPAPLNLKAAINFDNLALVTMQPYLNDLLRVTINEGTLSVNGDLALSSENAGDPLNGRFNGAINVNQFNSTDQSVNERLLGWQNLTIAPLEINFNPLAIAISDIRIEQPYGRIIVTEDRSTNLAKLSVSADTDLPAVETEQTVVKNSPKKGATAQSSAEKSTPIPIQIKRILINNGAAYFADLSLSQQFATSIQNISGEVNGLSSNNMERAFVDINGTVEEYGKALVKGKINLLSGDLYTDLMVKFSNIELSTMTPYSGRYAGYAIDKGKLNLQLNYKIAQGMLDAKNHLILDQFELGRSIASKEAVDLPLQFAIAILKDRNGVIDINLPARGNMDDPNFDISSIFINALVNVITKAVTAPFAIIGNLVGGDADQLSSVAFTAGSANLTPDQIANLAKLAQALTSRPKLMLEIRATVDGKADGDVLKQRKLDNRLKSSSEQQRAAEMEALLISRSGQSALDQIKADTLAAEKANPKPKLSQQKADTAEYMNALYNVLLTTETITDLELTNLAKQRISSIKNQLIDQYKVDNEQVFALQPSLDGRLKDNKIITDFSLTAR
jgi:hypothetical protein